MEFLEPQSLADAVHEKIYYIRLLLAGYEAELPAATCVDFVKSIRLVLTAVEDYHSEWQTYLASAWPQDLEIRSDLVRSTSKIALAILRNIERDLLPSLRSSLLQSPYLIKQMMERVIAPVASAKDIELTLVPTFDYVYGFSGTLDIAASLVEKLGGYRNKQQHLAEAAALPKWTVFLSFPLVEYESALNQVVLAHELAHLLTHLQDLPSKLKPFTLDETSFVALVAEVNESPLRYFAVPLTTPEEIEQHCYEVCSKMVESWMQEIMADLIAVHALGPAYFLSFLEFLAHSSADDVPDRTHPAPSYRCSRVLEELSFMEYSSIQTEISRFLWRSHDQIESSATLAIKRHQGPELVAHATVAVKLEGIRALVRDLCKDFSYKASKYINEVAPLAHSLSKGLVPMDAYREGRNLEPLSPVAILNAGAEVYATQWTAFQSLFVGSLGRPEHLQNLNRLIFKALELNEVVRAFHS